MAIYYGDGGNSSSGRVVQIAYGSTNSEDSGSENSWTNTGLIDLQFSNNVTSGNKVLLQIQLGMGEAYDNAWAQHGLFTIYCDTQGNLGDSTWGFTGGWVSGASTANSNMQYGFQRMSGSKLYTPSTTTPRYRLYRRRVNTAFTMIVGSTHHSSTNYNSGNTQLTAWEITA